MLGKFEYKILSIFDLDHHGIPSFVRFPFEAMSKTHLCFIRGFFRCFLNQTISPPWKNRPSFVTKAASLGSVALAGLLVVPLRALEVSNDEVSILRWKKRVECNHDQKNGGDMVGENSVDQFKW